MLMVTTGRAAEDGLRDTGCRIDAAAFRARLRRVGSRHLPERASRPSELVAELIDEAPAGIKNAPSEPSISSHHVADFQILNNDRAVALGVIVAELMRKMLALPPDLPMQVGNTKLGFGLVLRPFLPSSDGTLRTS